jgi:hypothetical protein
MCENKIKKSVDRTNLISPNVETESVDVFDLHCYVSRKGRRHVKIFVFFQAIVSAGIYEIRITITVANQDFSNWYEAIIRSVRSLSLKKNISYY